MKTARASPVSPQQNVVGAAWRKLQNSQRERYGMDPFRTLDLARARHDAMLHDAEVDRLLHDNAAATSAATGDEQHAARDPLLARLGDALVATGARLQERRTAAAMQHASPAGEAAGVSPVFVLHYLQYADGRSETEIFCRLRDPRDEGSPALLQSAAAW